MSAARICEEWDASLQQVFKELSAAAQIRETGVRVEIGEVAVRPAVGLDVDAGVLHLEDLLEVQGTQRPRRGIADPIDVFPLGRQCLSDHEDGRGNAVPLEDGERMLVDRLEAVVERDGCMPSRKSARKVQALHGDVEGEHCAPMC
jgi:hypothetical protein